MKKQFCLLALTVLFIFGCSNEPIEKNNDQLTANKFLEIITNSELQTAIALNSFSGKSAEQNGPIDGDETFIVLTDLGLVVIKFDDDKVFGFLGVMSKDKFKEKNGEVKFDTKANEVLCAVADTSTIFGDAGDINLLYSNLCPMPSFGNGSGSLTAKGSVMPSDFIKHFDEVGDLYRVNGKSKIDAKKIDVNNSEVNFISVKTQPNLALEDRLVCGANGTVDKVVSLKSTTDKKGKTKIKVKMD